MIEQYLQVKEQHQDCILFFRLEEETVGSMIVISKLPEIMAAMSKAFKRTAEVGKWK
jgi:hypothetical protein